MKKLLIILGIVTSLFFSAEVFAKKRGSGRHVNVSGYVKRDGTYVQPHYRTSPDSIKTNNWSYSGNVNPYTGKVGTNTDSSPNYRGRGYYENPNTNGYSRPAQIPTQPVLPPNSDYTVRHGELHNHRTASFYTD